MHHSTVEVLIAVIVLAVLVLGFVKVWREGRRDTDSAGGGNASGGGGGGKDVNDQSQ